MKLQKKSKKLCSLLLIVMLMLTIMPFQAFAAVDLTFASNSSVSIIKDGKFQLTDTQVTVNVQLDNRLEKCIMTIFSYAGNTSFDADDSHNTRLWSGYVTNGEKTVEFNSNIELKAGYKIIACLNVPIDDDNSGENYRSVVSQAIEIVDENGNGFTDYTYPDATIDEETLMEGANSLHISLSGDKRLFQAAKDGKTVIYCSIGMYPADETFDFEGENFISLSSPINVTEPIKSQKITLSEPLKAGYRVRAVVYWSQNVDIFLAKGNDYEAVFNLPDDSVLITALPQTPTVAINTPLYDDAQTFDITVDGDIPDGALLLVKKYASTDTTFATNQGTFLGNKDNLTKGTLTFTPTTKIAENDKIVAFMLQSGNVVAQSEPVSVTYRPAFSIALDGVVTSASNSVTFDVTALKSDVTNINIAKLCKVDSNDNINTTPLTQKYGQSAGKITFDLESGQLAKGDRFCLVLVYANGDRTMHSDFYTVTKPLDADSITIVEDSFSSTSTKATVIVNGFEELATDRANKITSTLFLTQGASTTNNDADSRQQIRSLSFTGPGTYNFTFDSGKLTDGNTLQAHIYVYNLDKDTTTYKYSAPITIGEITSAELAVAISTPVKATDSSFTVNINGAIPEDAVLIVKSFPAATTAFAAEQGTVVKVVTSGSISATTVCSDFVSDLVSGEKLVAFLQSNGQTAAQSEPVTIESATPTPQELTVTFPNDIKADDTAFAINVTGDIPSGAMLLVKSYASDTTSFAMNGGTLVGTVTNAQATNTVTVQAGSLKASRKVVAFLQNGGTKYAQSAPATVQAGAPIQLDTPTATLKHPTGITAGQTKVLADISFDSRAEEITATLYQFSGDTFDESTAEKLSTNSSIYRNGEISFYVYGKLKADSKLIVVVDTDGTKGQSNIINVLPSPNWGTPTVEFGVAAVKTDDKTVKLTVNYADEYIAMGDDFYCDVTIYKYPSYYTDDQFEDSELSEKSWIATTVAKANSHYNDQTREEITLTFYDNAQLSTDYRLIAKLRLPHTEWADEEVDYLSASVPIIEAGTTLPVEKVVLYNVSADTSKGARLREALDEINLPYEEIEYKDLNQLVGYLAGRDSDELFVKNEEPYNGKTYDTEFMLMCNVSMSTLDKILAQMNKYGVSIDHKAMVTDINQYWEFHELLDEIANEHEVFQNLIKLNNLVKEAEKLTAAEYGTRDEWADFTQTLNEAKELMQREEPEPTAEELDQAHDKLAPLYTALTGKSEIKGDVVITITKQANDKYTISADVVNGNENTDYIYTWNNNQSGATIKDIDAKSLIALKVTITANDKINSLTAQLAVPPAPQATATATKKAITLNWSADIGTTNRPTAESYLVKLFKDDKLVDSKTTTDTTITLDGLTANTSYTVKIAAISPVGQSDMQILTVKTKKSSGSGNAMYTYSVDFNTNGGNHIDSQDIKAGSTAIKPANPKKDGYTFKGWYSDKDLKNRYDFSTAVTAPLILYAAWSKDSIDTASDSQNEQIILTIGNKDALVYGDTVTNDVAPLIINNRVMLPARFIVESLGGHIEWIAQQNQVVITKGSTTIVLTIGANTAWVNGESVQLDAPAFILEGRTYLPIRFITENLGAEVIWQSESQTVTIK